MALFGLSARTPTLWPLLMIHHSSWTSEHGRWVSRATSPGENEGEVLSILWSSFRSHIPSVWLYSSGQGVTKIHSASKERKYRPHRLMKVMPICHFKKTMEDVTIFGKYNLPHQGRETNFSFLCILLFPAHH